jgi:hypothetical protein
VRYYDTRLHQIWISRNFKFLCEQLPQAPDVQREGEVGSMDVQPSGGDNVPTPTNPLQKENVNVNIPISEVDRSSERSNENRSINDASSTEKGSTKNQKRSHSPENADGMLPRRTKGK